MARPGLGSTIERRIAMVIGNSAYRHAGVLKNPVNDARAMARVLGRLGFEVIQGANLGLEGIGDALGEFESRLHERPDVALLYYAGHGLQVDGRNYLVPIDVQISQKTHLSTRAVLLSDILDEMAASASTSLLFLDACRENPFSENIARSLGQTGRSMSVRGGLAPMERAGTFIAYATAPDHIAFDGAGQNSPFTSALVGLIETPGLSVGDLMIDVRNKVIAETKGKQQPWDQSSLRTRFSFVPDPAAGTAPPTSVAPDTAAAYQSNAGPRAFRPVSRSVVVAAAGILGAVGLGFLVWTKLGVSPTGMAPPQVATADAGVVSIKSVDRPSPQPQVEAQPVAPILSPPTESGVPQQAAEPPPAESSVVPVVPVVPAERFLDRRVESPGRKTDDRVLLKHIRLDDRIEQLAVSASGKYVALASIRQSATTVSVWNIHTGAQERSLITGPWGVDHLAWGAADDTLSVFARPQGASVLTRFHVGSGEQKRILSVPPQTQLLFDNDGQLQGAVYPGEDYPSTFQDGVLQAHTNNRSPIWAPYRVDEFGFFVPRGQKQAGPVYQTQQRASSCSGGTRLIAYLARQDLVVWAGRSGCFLVWNLKSMKPVRVVEGAGFTNALVITSSADGQLLAIGGRDGAVIIWDTNAWKELRRFQASSRRITQLAFSPDGRHLATTGDVDGAAKVWDVLTGSVRAEFLHQAGGALGPMAVTRDGTTLVTTGYDVKAWKMPQ